MFKSFHNFENQDINADYEYEMKSKLTDKELKDKIQKLLNIDNLNEILKYNKEIRNEKIKSLKIIKGKTNIQIARVIGVKKGIVEKAMKE